MSQLKELTDAINIIKPTLGNQKLTKELPIRKWALEALYH